MSELKDETLELEGNFFFTVSHWELFPTQVTICRVSQYSNCDDIDIDISKDKAINIVNFLQKHYKLEKQADK